MKKICRHCKEKINSKAKVCHHCGKYQSFTKEILTNLPILISIGLLLISTVQLSITQKEKKESNEALLKADSSLTTSIYLENEYRNLGDLYSKVVLVSTELIQEVYKSGFIWNDDMNNIFSHKIDSLSIILINYSEKFKKVNGK